MKKLIAVALMLGLLATAASAYALPLTFEVAGINDKTLRATVTADYNPLTAIASFSILNTTTTHGKITGFAFSLPNNGLGIGAVTDLSGIPAPPQIFSPNPNFHLLNSGAYMPNTIDSPQLAGNFDVGMGTGSNFAGGGNPNQGILMGQLATFSLLFSGPGTGSWNTSSILAALAQEQGPHFAVRFQATGQCGGDSDVGTPTPIPGAVWLLGSGLLGVMGFKRRRAAE